MRGARTLLPDFTRYALGVQYYGPAYNGWTPSNNSPPGQRYLPTILSTAIERFVGADNYANLLVSSRTDAGVHAFRNVIQVDLARSTKSSSHSAFSTDVVRRAINHHLQIEQVCITDVQEMDANFDARGCATGRTYVYRIHSLSPSVIGHNKIPMNSYLFHSDRAWVHGPLDTALMREAAGYFMGEQDFTSVQGPQCQSPSAWRDVQRLDVVAHKPRELVADNSDATRSIFLMVTSQYYIFKFL